jgi:NAD(P)-dependent dehydrogenase (short-subunit alcohol dehydrogenase family)
MSPIEGKVALVTGGGHGIGRAIVLALAAEGAAVAIIGRNTALLDETKTEVEGRGGRAKSFVCDVGDRESVRATFEETRATFGPVNILVNNAGLTASYKFQDTPDDIWDRIIQTNVSGAFYCCKAALPDMIARRWGRIITIASMAGLGGLAYSAAYSASKHAQLGLTRSLALEVARYNIAVNAVCPAWVDTDMLHDAVVALVQKTGRTPDDARTDLLKISGQTRAIPPEDVAAGVLKLACLDDASTTGQAISMF